MLWHSKALLPSLTLFHEDADDNNWFENRRQWDTRIIPGSHPPPLAPHEDSAALHPPFDFLSMSLSCSSFLLHVFCFITVLTHSPSSLLNPFQTFFLHSLDLSHILMLPSEKKQNKYIMYRKVCDAWVFGCMLVCEEVPACIPLRLNRGRRGWKKRREWKVKKIILLLLLPSSPPPLRPLPTATDNDEGTGTLNHKDGRVSYSQWLTFQYYLSSSYLEDEYNSCAVRTVFQFNHIILSDFSLQDCFQTLRLRSVYLGLTLLAFIGFVRRVKYLCTPACPPRKVPSESPWWWRKEGKCCITDFGHCIVKEVVMERWTTWLKEN